MPKNLIDTTGMDNETWLSIREHGLGKTPLDEGYIPYTITGSGASSALGVNPWVSDEEYRDKKMGIKPVIDATFNEESKAAGHVFEPFVAINFLRYMRSNFPEVKINLIKDCMRDILPYMENACPDKISYDTFVKSFDDVIKEFNKKWKLNPSAMYQCSEEDEEGNLKYPFALANIDGLVEVNGKLGIFEAKTTSSSTAKYDYWEKGKIPPYYYWQLVFYMAVMDVDFAYITCCWGFTLTDMAVILLERDKEVERDFMEFLSQFVDDMACGLPLEESKSDPELVSNWYYRMYGVCSEEDKTEIELPSYCKKVVSEAMKLETEIENLKAELKALESKKTSLANELIPIMKDKRYAKLEMDETVYGVKVKPSMHRDSFDSERFIKEHPELIGEFTSTEVNISALKKNPATKKLVEEYVVKGTPNEKGKATLELFKYEKKASEEL